MADGSRADRLRQARVDAGFKSASAAARALNVNTATYMHHENGTREFGEDAARHYATALRTNASWLMLGEGDPGSDQPQINASLRDRAAAAFGFITAPPSKSRPLDRSSYDGMEVPEISPGYSLSPDFGGSHFERYINYKTLAYHKVLGVWRLPSFYLSEIGFPTDRRAIIYQVFTDALLPRFRKGDRLIVHAGIRDMLDDGYYLVSAVDGALAVRYLARDLFRSPPTLRVSLVEGSSDYELVEADSVIIVGLVVGNIGEV